MKIRYAITIGDLTAFMRYYTRHSTLYRLAFVLLRWVLPGMMLALGLPYVGVDWCAALCWLAPGVLLMLGVRWLFESLLALQVRARHREGDNKGVLGPHELELAPPDLIERTPVNESRHWLGAIEKVATTPTHALIFISSFAAHVVPRAGVTDRDFEAFVRAVTEEVEAAKRNRSPAPAAPRPSSGGAAEPPSPASDGHVFPK
jgi:hypothetical protein